MKTISHELIETVWDETNELSPEAVRNLSSRLGAQQQALLVYLLATEERIGHPALVHGGLMTPAIVLCLAAERVLGQALPPIAPETLEAADERNAEVLAALDEGPEIGFGEAVSRMLEAYDQLPALFWTMHYLMAVCDEDPDNFGEDCCEAWLGLKTVIDALVATADGNAGETSPPR